MSMKAQRGKCHLIELDASEVLTSIYRSLIFAPAAHQTSGLSTIKMGPSLSYSLVFTESSYAPSECHIN